MLEILAKQSPSALVGLLFSLFFIWWIKPTTNEGTIFVVVICVVISIVFGTILRYVFGRNTQKK